MRTTRLGSSSTAQRKRGAADRSRRRRGHLVGASLVALAFAGEAGAHVWVPQTSGTANDLNHVEFQSATNGWASGLNATLLRTTDSGAHWYPVTVPGVAQGEGFNFVGSPDGTTIWAGGEDAIARTTNGGSTWNSNTGYGYTRSAHSPVSSTVCWAGGYGVVGWFPCFMHFRQTWTGSAWTITRWNSCGDDIAVAGIDMVDADNGWSVGTYGRIWRIASGSGTPSFTPQTSGTGKVLHSVQMRDLTTGWIVGETGTVLYTTDGGAHWTAGDNGDTFDLKSVYFVDATNGWAVGDGGTILASTDGGVTWSTEDSGVTTGLAGVGCSGPETCYAVGQGGVILKRVPGADLAVSKSDGVAWVVAGQEVTYTIAVTNSGPHDVVGASVADSIPPGLTGATWTCAATGEATCPASGSGGIAATVDLPVGDGVEFSLTATVVAGAESPIVNTAAVAIGTGLADPNPANDSASDSDLFPSHADVAITKTNGVDLVLAGNPVEYTVELTNGGPDLAPLVAVSDDFPAALAGVGWSCVANGGASCPASGSGDLAATVDLPVGGVATFTATGTLASSATGTLVNTATAAVMAGMVDDDPDDNSATDSDTIGAAADLRASKSDGVTVVLPGHLLVYSIAVVNDGPSDAPQSSVSDTFPATLVDVAWTCAPAGGASCPASGSGDIAALVDLPAGTSVTFTATAVLDSDAMTGVENTATAATTGPVGDPDPNDNTAVDTDLGLEIFHDGFEGGDWGEWSS